MPPMPHGTRYATPASVQLPSPVRKARLRPLWSARRPAKRRLGKATTENVPITKPTVRSEPPRSWRTCGASPGRTVPKPRKPRNVAAIRHQKRPGNDVDGRISHHYTGRWYFRKVHDAEECGPRQGPPHFVSLIRRVRRGPRSGDRDPSHSLGRRCFRDSRGISPRRIAEYPEGPPAVEAVSGIPVRSGSDVLRSAVPGTLPQRS